MLGFSVCAARLDLRTTIFPAVSFLLLSLPGFMAMVPVHVCIFAFPYAEGYLVCFLFFTKESWIPLAEVMELR